MEHRNLCDDLLHGSHLSGHRLDSMYPILDSGSSRSLCGANRTLVQGQVVSISAKPNVSIKKGDVLFEIDPTSYQYTVNQAKRRLKQLEVMQQEAAGVQVAEASIAKAEADVRVAKSDFEMSESAAVAISKQEIIQLKEKYAAVQAALKQVVASKDQAIAAHVASKKQS